MHCMAVAQPTPSSARRACSAGDEGDNVTIEVQDGSYFNLSHGNCSKGCSHGFAGAQQ